MLPSLLLIALCPVVLAQAVRGVPPEKQALYKPDANGKWRCLLDPSIELSFSQINNNFCNCPDGSDEPGTNACPFTKDSPKYYYCANEGYKEAYIENYKLNDGVCDYDVCCDGSDEYLEGSCPNVCGQVKQQYDEFVASKKKDVEAALGIKSGLVEKAQGLKQQLVASAKTLLDQILEDEARLRALNEQLSLARSDVGEEDTTGASAVDQLLREHQQNLEQQFSQLLDHAEQERTKIQALEAILNNLLQNYNPNFNDQAVKQAVSSFADYVSNKPAEESKPVYSAPEIDLSQLSQHLQQVVSVEKPSAPAGDLSILGKLMGLRRSFLNAAPDAPVSVEEAPATPRLDANVEEIAEEITRLEKSLHQKRSEESIYKDSIDASFGEQEIYRAVKGVYVHKKIGEYSYKLGFLDALYQDNTLVGRFIGVNGHSMYFAQGSKCWNGPQRSARVDMVCGPEHDLVSVSEPEKCLYQFLMTSPLACEALTEDQIAREFKVDLAKLRL